MTHNRPLTIYTTTNRKAKVYQAAPMTVQELFDRLRVSQPLPYPIEAYRALRKPQQDNLKDIGGYILGELAGGRRKSGAVLSRCGAVLDADNLPAGATDEVIRRVASLGLCCCVYSTAKHSHEAPRLRIVFIFSEDIPADMYPPVIRLLCQTIQPEMTWFDQTTDEANRMMYWGAHCQDVTPIFYAQDGGGQLDVTAWLAQRLPHWEDTSSWPRFPGELEAVARAVQGKARQEDPEAKKGVVGAWCRVHDVYDVMDNIIPGVYEPVDNAQDRYTFTGGSTAGGAYVYEGGKFLFSHHATDPCSKTLVNAWDLARIHLFGDLDDEAAEGAKGNRLPSFTAMVERAREDPAVQDELAREAFTTAFLGEAPQDEAAALALGRYAGEPFSLEALRAGLKAMGVQVRRNLITGKAEITGMPPQYSEENAVNTLPVLLVDKLRAVGVKGVSKTTVTDYMAAVVDENRFNPVLDMLQGTVWSGTERFTGLAKILGIASDGFQALLLRKWLIQCVAMAHNTPRHIEAAEGVLTLQGEQGAGKTSVFRRLAIRPEWLAEGVTLDMRNKDDILRATSAWITELGELDSTLKREQSSLKAFITQRTDRIRAPYAREESHSPRRTSFGASVNPGRFLKDDTGDRRFFVIPIFNADIPALINTPDEWFVQLWAEVYRWWQENPQKFRLSDDEKLQLDKENQQYRELLPMEEEIRQALNFDLPPARWCEFSASELGKQLYFGQFRPGDTGKIGRVLTKLAREDRRITRRVLRGVPLYCIPILRSIGEIENNAVVMG